MTAPVVSVADWTPGEDRRVRDVWGLLGPIPAGTLVEIEMGERSRIYLVGHVNRLGGNTDEACELEPEDVVLRYTRITVEGMED